MAQYFSFFLKISIDSFSIMNNILDKLFKFSGLKNILLSLNLIKIKPDEF